jgi:hypothetical protein
MSTEPLTFLQFALIAIMVMLCLVYWRLGDILNALKGGGSGSAGLGSARPPAAVGERSRTIHPGLSDEKFIAIISAAVASALGQPVKVVGFKPLSTMDWTWAVQGRVSLHKNKV